MKPKDYLSTLRKQNQAKIQQDILQLKKDLLRSSESKNLHDYRNQRRQLARLLTVQREINLINNE